MEQVFLGANVPLTKSFSFNNNNLEKTQYPLVKNFTSYREQYNSLNDLLKLIKAHAAQGHCMLKGRLHRDLNNESRANSTIPDDDTVTLVFDLDNLTEYQSVQEFMDDIGLSDVSYIVQYSASYQVDPKKTGISAHIIVMLDRAVPAGLLKAYLQNLNFETPKLAKQVTLTATDVSLTFPVDITVAQSDKLIYIAPPDCTNFPDPMPNRILLVKKSTDVFTFPDGIPHGEKSEKARRHKINELRAAKGLAARRGWTLKEDGSCSYVPNPTAGIITGLKQERGYTYLNLNHGDSWAYYHPDNNPTVIYSFKGDGPFRTKDLAPDYWNEISKTLEAKPVGGVIHMAYRHFHSAQYYNAIYDQTTHELRIAKANSLIQLQHFMDQYNKPWSGSPTDWDHIYDATPVSYEQYNRINVEDKTINLYTPPEYAKTYNPHKVYELPEVIWKLLLHACGGHEEFTLNLINNFAYMLQTGKPVHTAIVLHGRTGTGKGILFNEILPRVFGTDNVSRQKAAILNEPYNGYMEHKQIVAIDEIDADMIKNTAATNSFLKNSITEPRITIRKMYAEPREINKTCSFLMSANSPAPLYIPQEDRRMNAGEYQPEPFVTTDEELDMIRHSCEEFYGFLRQFKYDAEATRKIIETESRKKIISTAAVGLDEFAHEVIKLGNFMYLLDMLPMKIPMDVQQSQLPLKEYATVLAELLGIIHQREQKVAIFRDELRILLSYNFPKIPAEPAKFSSMVKHHRMYMETVRRGAQVGKGLYITFRFSEEDFMTANNIFATTLRAFANE